MVIEHGLRLLPISAQQHVRGKLHLGFAYAQSEQQTRLVSCEQQPPFKVIRAFAQADGGALVHLHNLSGGVLGGDSLALTVDVGTHACVQLTSTSATRLYRSRPEAAMAQQTTAVHVAEHALLEYVPDPLIPFAGARYQQRTTIELAEGAGLFWWESVAPGREARGEVFEYDVVKLALDITAQGRPLALERLHVEPRRRPPASLARLGGATYFCSFYICRVGLEAARWSQLEQALSELALELSVPNEISWGVSALVAHGLVVRALSRTGRAINKGLLAFWHVAKQELYGREAIVPRKVY